VASERRFPVEAIRRRWQLWLGLVAAIAVAAVVLFVLTRGGEPAAQARLRQQAGEDPLVAALLELTKESAKPVTYRFEDGFPEAVHFRVEVAGDTATERASTYLNRYGDLYRLGKEGFGLHLRRVQQQPDGDTVVFYQTYRGLEVYGGELAVYLAGPFVVATAGALLANEPRLNLQPSLTRGQAEAIGRAEAGTDALVLAQSKLIVFDPSLLGQDKPDPRLAWRVVARAESSVESLIDANTGAVLLSGPLGAEDTFEDYDLDLEDAENDSNSVDDYCYDLSDETEVGDADGIIEDYQGNDIKSQDAIEMWNHMKNTYKFYKEEMGRSGWDDDGGEHDVYIRATVPNASFSECVLIQFKQQYITFNTVVHEFTHAVIYFTSALNNGLGSQSVNESMSDIMAAVAENNWVHGADHLPQFNPPIRSLADPPSTGDPDQFSEVGNEEHFNAGITNKAAFLISEGGIHPGTMISVNGIGIDKTGELFYDVLTSLPSSTPIPLVRDVAVAEVNKSLAWNQFLEDNPEYIGQFGINFNDWTEIDLCSVKNGFKAVELGEGDLDCDGVEDPNDLDKDGDGLLDAVDNCKNVWNANNQLDSDGDTVGDVCDSDDDNDGVKDVDDNCDFDKNPNQSDIDNNGIGDACQDNDGDGWKNVDDNCDNAWNPGQEDLDKDGAGNPCDEDDDNDGVLDGNDNCPVLSNSDQANADGDQHGDACDNCPDNYEHPKSILPPNSDKDGDAIGDLCDPNPNGAGLIDLSDFGGLIEALARPDGEEHNLRLEAPAGSSLTLPLSLCPGGPCEDAPPPDQCYALQLGGLEGTIGAIIGDDTGMGKARADGSDDLLRFQRRGGRDYYLTLYFSPHFDGEATLLFRPSICEKETGTGPRDATSAPAPTPTAAGPTQTGAPTATPVVVPAGLPAATATAVATGTASVAATATPRVDTPTPTWTPTPTPTPRLADTPTPTPTPRVTDTPTPTPTPRLPFTPTPTSTPRF
jgi:Zn-dependent metalloprotease